MKEEKKKVIGDTPAIFEVHLLFVMKKDIERNQLIWKKKNDNQIPPHTPLKVCNGSTCCTRQQLFIEKKYYFKRELCY